MMIPIWQISNENIAKYRNLARSDHQLTIRETADELNLCFYAILTKDFNLVECSPIHSEIVVTRAERTRTSSVPSAA